VFYIKRKKEKYEKHPKLFFLAILRKFLSGFMRKMKDDEFYLRIYYWLKTGKKLNLTSPKTFNEKTQWIKLYDRKPIYTQMVDKYNVLELVREKIGASYVVPLFGVWNCFDEIDFGKLPNQFVLKCTHDSGGIAICKDKGKFDFVDKSGNQFTSIENVSKRLSRSLENNYYLKGREWVYKNVPRRIIAQQFIQDEAGGSLMDYKIFTFNGKPKYIQVHFDKSSNVLKANFYSTDWVYQDFYIEEVSDKTHTIPKPKHLEKMLWLAEILAKGTYFLRVDFFYVNNKIYFSELTFYNWSGFGEFFPGIFNEIFGSYILLPYEVNR